MTAYPDDGELTLEIANAKVSGWQAIRVSRGIERLPSDFDISVTEKFPGSSAQVSIFPGQVCRVRIGSDLVLTGYVDVYEPSIAPDTHTVRVRGRSTCEDLVDSMAVVKGSVMNNTTVLAIATAVCADYGVTITDLAGVGPNIPQIVFNLGETAYQVIERVARFGQMLVYDDPTGNLVLAQVGKEVHASGFSEGVNVLDASVSLNISQRYSEYRSYRLTTDPYIELQGGIPGVDGNQLEIEIDPAMATLIRPDGKPRVRRMAIISEQMIDQVNYAILRARWEAARRYGRSQAVRVVADSWRDSKGALWTPNKLVPVKLPSLKVPNLTMVIGDVTYLRDDQGTRAELLLMVKEAYAPEPAIINPFDPLITQAIIESQKPQPRDGRRDQG